MPEHNGLSVIVPVYNERNTLAEIIRRMRQVDVGMRLEIILVDDASTDGSVDILKAVEDSTVRVLRHDRNQGKGAAIRTGLEVATGDIVLIQDADLEYDPEDWPRLIRPLLRGRAQVVYGSRFTGERRSTALASWARNRLLTLATNVLYNTTLSDVETGYKVFDRSVIDAAGIDSDGFGFEPEITAKVLRMGHKIYEVPVAYAARDYDEGKKITWKDGFSALYILGRYRRWRAP